MDTNASLTYFAINSAVFASVNVATSVFSILMNIFFIYCMVFQQSEQELLKQPLNVLQGILVGCNITINACTLLNVCSSLLPYWDYFIVYQCMIYVMMASVTSSFWQNICAIIIYLWKHLKNMEKSSTLSSPRFQRQIRMTIRKLIQSKSRSQSVIQFRFYAVMDPDYNKI
ncbi:hypothetical protein Q7C36_008656 [Tachysurus vachellii]|uniref:Uncharacterized protein n=1 Tax=Tachysurus vachellii TaxID=175792 RepID=A0AA88T0G9_TACVA|nr:hypothetical protein Q7C36_008656 [Tachysurus vachellii]